MDARKIGLAMVVGGATAQVSGLGIDAWLHASENLGADRALSLENLGHVLFVGGLVSVVLGAALALAGPRLYRSTEAGPGVRMIQFGAPAAAALLVVAGLVGASTARRPRHPPPPPPLRVVALTPSTRAPSPGHR